MVTIGDQPEQLSRWLSVIGLIQTAEQIVSTRGGGAWPALALVSSDAAVEAMLGMIATPSADPPEDKDSFDKLYEKARKALHAEGVLFASGLPQRLHTAHRQRNGALHLGNEVAVESARRAIRAASDLRVLVRSHSDVLKLVDDQGVVRAVGQMTGVEAITDAMNEADAALVSGDTIEALNQAAIALDWTTMRLEPRLDPDNNLAIFHAR